jgi:hypothetical protein
VYGTGTAQLWTTGLCRDKPDEPQDLGDGDRGAKLAIIDTRLSCPPPCHGRQRIREEEPVLCLRRIVDPLPYPLDFVRRTSLAFRLLPGHPQRPALPLLAVREGLDDKDPQVRQDASETLEKI